MQRTFPGVLISACVIQALCRAETPMQFPVVKQIEAESLVIEPQRRYGSAVPQRVGLLGISISRVAAMLEISILYFIRVPRAILRVVDIIMGRPTYRLGARSLEFWTCHTIIESFSSGFIFNIYQRKVWQRDTTRERERERARETRACVSGCVRANVCTNYCWWLRPPNYKYL